MLEQWVTQLTQYTWDTSKCYSHCFLPKLREINFFTGKLDNVEQFYSKGIKILSHKLKKICMSFTNIGLLDLFLATI